MTFLFPLLGSGSSLQLDPNPDLLPGAQVLQQLANGVGGWALIAAMVGIVVGAVMWAFGRRTTPMKFLVSRPSMTAPVAVARRPSEHKTVRSVREPFLGAGW